MKAFRQFFSNFSILWFLIFLPLFIDNAYFNIVEAKFQGFFLSVLLLFLPMAVILINRFIKRKSEEIMSLDLIDTGTLCFSGAVLLSCLLSENIKASFFGSDGWNVGAFSILALTFLYFFFSRNNIYRQNIWLPIYAVNVFIFITGLVQFAGVDLLGFSENILPKQYFQYISTFGNTNWYAGYLCLLIPMVFVFFLSAKTMFSYYVNLVFLSLALSNLLICISDGAYLGMGFCAFFALVYVFRDLQRVKKAFIIFIIFAAEAIIINLLPCYAPMLDKATGISSVMLDIRVSLALLFLSAAAYLLLSFYKKDSETLCRILRRVFFCLLLAAVLGAVVYTIMTFSDKWGSHRGLIWRVSFERFSEFDIKQKLFGIGPELLRDQYLEVQRVFENLPVLSSHSEPIQILMTTGIVGFSSFAITLFGLIFSFYKNIGRAGKDNSLIYAFFLPLAAYFGQSLVNSATTVNLCLLCIILSFYRISVYNAEKQRIA